MVIDKMAIRDDLVKAFISYQTRLDNPMPPIPRANVTATEAMQAELSPYQYDPVFRRKVDSLVAGVMHIIDKHT